MRHSFKFAGLAVLWLACLKVASAQDLSPRAYVITPLHSNAVTLTWSFYDGSIDYNGALPVSGATGTYSVPIFSYYHGFSLLWTLRQHRCLFALWSRQFSGNDPGRGEDTFTAPVFWIRPIASR